MFSSAHSEDLLEPVALPNLSKRQNPAHQRKRNTVQYQLYRKRNSNGIHFPCRISKRTTRMTRTTKTTKTATTGAGDSAPSRPIPPYSTHTARDLNLKGSHLLQGISRTWGPTFLLRNVRSFKTCMSRTDSRPAASSPSIPD